MKRLFIGVFLSMFLLPVPADPDDKTIRDEVNAKVTQLIELLRDSYAQEFPDYRGIQILEDKKSDRAIAVAVFTVESFALGNDYTQFMAVFANLSEESAGHPKRLSLLDVIAVGGKGVRGVEFKSMKMERSKDGILITVPTLEYGPKDAMCCPSVKSKAQFVIDPNVGGRLREIK